MDEQQLLHYQQQLKYEQQMQEQQMQEQQMEGDYGQEAYQDDDMN